MWSITALINIDQLKTAHINARSTVITSPTIDLLLTDRNHGILHRYSIPVTLYNAGLTNDNQWMMSASNGVNTGVSRFSTLTNTMLGIYHLEKNSLDLSTSRLYVHHIFVQSLVLMHVLFVPMTLSSFFKLPKMTWFFERVQLQIIFLGTKEALVKMMFDLTIWFIFLGIVHYIYLMFLIMSM